MSAVLEGEGLTRIYSWTRAAVCTAPLLAAAACAPSLPASWKPLPEASAEVPYRGRVGSLMLSADGATLAIFYSKARGEPGVAIMDGWDGSLRRMLDLPGDRVIAAALSTDGSRLLTLGQCRAGQPNSDGKTCLVETEVASGLERIIRVDPHAEGWASSSIWGLAYSASDPRTVLMLTASTQRYIHSGDSSPKPPFRLFALVGDKASVQVAQWLSDEPSMETFHARGAVQLLPSGDVRIAGWLPRVLGSAQLTLRQRGKAADINVFATDLKDVFVSSMSFDGKRSLAVQIWQDRDNERQDVVLLDRDAAPSTPQRRLTSFAAAISSNNSSPGTKSVAISGDGRRAAMIAELLDDSVNRMVLHLVNLDSGTARSLDLTALAGLGPTYSRVQFGSEDLLTRLRALLEGRWLNDAGIMSRTLGLRLLSGDDGTLQQAGDAPPPSGLNAILVQRSGTAFKNGRRYAEAQLDLTSAGPCLTAEGITRVFGTETEPEQRSTGFPSHPWVQPRQSLDYSFHGERVAHFGLHKQYCAQQVVLRHPIE